MDLLNLQVPGFGIRFLHTFAGLADQPNNPVLVFVAIFSSVATLVSFFGDRMMVIVGWPGTQSSTSGPGRMAIGSLAAFCMVAATVLVVAGRVGQTLEPPSSPVAPGSPPAIDVAILSDAAFRLGADHRYAEALGLYRVIEQASPKFPLLRLNMSYCFREIGDLNWALRYAEDAARDAPPANIPAAIGDAFYNLAAIRFAAGDNAGSLDALAKAIANGFPSQCDVAKDDPDLLAMASEAALVPYVQKILADGTKDCRSAK